MTDVYQTVSTTNDVEDRYAKNEVVRRAILGPFSLLLKCIGFDDTYSLLKKETRSRCIAWICTPLSIIGLVVLLANFIDKVKRVEHAMSYQWAEVLTLVFLALQSVAAAAFLLSRTRSLFFLSFYEGWTECARLAAETKEEKENGEAEGGAAVTAPRCAPSRPLFVVLALLFFSAATITSSTKYALYRGYVSQPNTSVTSSPLLDRFFSLEPLICLWAALVSASAFSVYGIVHGIMQDVADDLLVDLKGASSSRALAARLPLFAARHQAVIVLARLIAVNMSTFATFGFITGTMVNAFAMYLSIAYMNDVGGLANICVVLWTILALAALVVILMQPAAVQTKLNEINEVLIADKEIWKGDINVAKQAELMLTRQKFCDTKVSVIKAFRLSPFVANGLMLLAPAIGGTLSLFRIFG